MTYPTYANRCRQISTSTGNGDFTLGAALTTFQQFIPAVPSGSLVDYEITPRAGTEAYIANQWEVGTGVVVQAGDFVTLQRNTVQAGSSGTSKVNFLSGIKEVSLVLSAERINEIFPGNVAGPSDGVSTNGAVALWDGVTGRLLKNGQVPGTIYTQNASAVAITGGTINGTAIGGTTPASGAFTALSGSVTATGTTTAVTLADSAEWTVERFGAVGDGVTNDRAALVAAAAAITARGGGSLAFSPGKIYRVDLTGVSFSGNYKFMTFDGCTGVEIIGNGATLDIDWTWTGTEIMDVFDVKNTTGFTVRDLNYTQEVQPIDDTYIRGGTFVYATQGSGNIHVENCDMTGGRGLVVPRKENSDPASYEVRGIVILNCYIYRVGYGLNCQQTGHDAFVRGLRTEECFRSYFPYGVENHDVQLTSLNHRGSDCFLALQSGISNKFLRNVRLDYTMQPRTIAANSGACLTIETRGPDAQQIENIHAILQINDTGPTYFVNQYVDIRKDTSPVGGNTLRNICIEGVAVTTAGPDNKMDILTNWGTGTDDVSNIRIGPFRMKAAATATINVNAAKVTSGLVLDGIITEGTVVISGTIPPASYIQGQSDATGTVDVQGATVRTSTVRALSSAGLEVRNSSGARVALLGSGPGTGTTLDGSVVFSTDNTFDIGAAGTTRPRTGYFASSVITPDVQATGSAGLALRNSSGARVALLGAGPGTGTTFDGGINITGGITATGAITTSTTSYVNGGAQLGVANAAGNVRDLAIWTGTTGASGGQRWLLRGTSDAESGADAGTNFNLVRRSDTGSNLGTVLYAIRSTGVVGIGGSAGSECLTIGNGTGGTVSHRGGATTIVSAASHLSLRSYTVATLPSAATAGQLIYVSDGTSNQRLAVSDGTNWRFPSGSIVS